MPDLLRYFLYMERKARPVSEGGGGRRCVVAVWVGGRGSDGGRRPRNCQVVTTQLFSYIIRDAVVRSTSTEFLAHKREADPEKKEII
jgi:hypothetical protein